MLKFPPHHRSSRVRRRGIVALTGVALAAGLVLSGGVAAYASLSVTVINTDGQGVASRPGPHLNPTNGYGAPAGAAVTTVCWAWGDAVGPNNNKLWWFINYAGRQFYASDRYLSTPDYGQPPAGEPQCGTQPGPSPVQPDENSWFTLTARNSGQAVDVRGGTAANGTPVQQYTGNGTNSQKWRFVHTDSGYYQLVSALTGGRVLDVSGGGTANGSLAQTWAWAGGANQQWEPFDAGSGYVTLKPRHVGRCLDVPGGSQNSGVQLQIYDCNGTASQQFLLTNVGGVGSSAGRLNQGIAQVANSASIGNSGGYCLPWVEHVISAAGGPALAFGLNASTYQQQWSQVANPVASMSAAAPGDIVQWYAPTTAPYGEMEHTSIIVSTANGGTVRDSNWDNHGTILQGTFGSRNGWMTGHYGAGVQIWRMKNQG